MKFRLFLFKLLLKIFTQLQCRPFPGYDTECLFDLKLKLKDKKGRYDGSAAAFSAFAVNEDVEAESEGLSDELHSRLKVRSYRMVFFLQGK
jgi:transcriptional antiterminator Rof (Rho-off)